MIQSEIPLNIFSLSAAGHRFKKNDSKISSGIKSSEMHKIGKKPGGMTPLKFLHCAHAV
jgi:hypothetical protein